MGDEAEEPMVRRTRRALALVAAAALALAASGALAGEGPGGSEEPAVGGAAEAGQAVLDGAALADALAAQGVASGAEGPPEWFCEEVLAAEGCQGALAAADWSVVGLSRQGPADEAFAGLVRELAGRGWSAYESGVANAATLVKEEGEVRWMTMQCVEAGSSTSVVLQLRRSSC